MHRATETTEREHDRGGEYEQVPDCRMDTSPVPDWIMENVWQHLAEVDLLISRRLA